MAIQMELYELKNLCMEMASLGAGNSTAPSINTKSKMKRILNTSSHLNMAG